MAVDEAAAVVDPGSLRVHGVRGLRVADASVMPHCIRANTEATPRMIAERISQFMLERN